MQKTKKLTILLLLPLLLGLFLSVGLSNANAVPVLNDGLVGYWDFNEGSGIIAIDYSGFNNHGTITNAVYVDGVWGDALRFDGDGDYVLVSAPSQLQLGSHDFTISLWLNASSFDNDFMAIEKGTGYAIYLDNGRLKVTANDGSYWVDTLEDLSPNTLYMISFSFNATNGEIIVYLNGNNHFSSLGNAATPALDNNLAIAAISAVNGFFANGLIDDVRIYDRVLSQSEVTYLYVGEPDISPSPSPSPTLVPVTSGELNNSFLFVLAFMSVFCVVGLVWFGRVPVVPFLIGLFTFLVALYSALGGIYTFGVPQSWFGLFVALFGGLTMLLVGLGVRVRR